MERILITREPQAFILVPILDGTEERMDTIIRTADIVHVKDESGGGASIITLTFASRAEWYTPLTVREIYDLMCPARETHIKE